MHRIMRYIRQNKKQLIRILLITVFIIGIIQLLNYLAGKNIQIGKKEKENSIYDESNGTILSGKSAVSGKQITKKELKAVNSKIEEFVNYCNEGQIEQAYNLLSDSCKEEFYTSLDSFRIYYYEPIFQNEKRLYTIENWVHDTYMVTFKTDLLATGKPSEDTECQDYITVETVNGEKKLNVNKFIGKEEINKSATSNDVEIVVLYRNKYMEFEEYEIKVTNNTGGTILLDQLINTDTMYLKDNNKLAHKAYSNELSKDNFKIYKGHTKTIKIKFDNPYISNREIYQICFSDIVLDYDINNKGDYKKAEININL